MAGAIPLLRPLRESLHGDRDHPGDRHRQRHHQLHPVQYGHHRAPSFHDALEEATALGYAEADPTADVEGFDAAAKAAILASLAFHTRVRAADVHREGITEVTAADVASAKAMGCTIKLLCIASSVDGAVSVRVHPAMIPRTPSAGQRRRRVQRGLRRGRGGRPAHVLRPRRRRGADGQRGRRRHRRRGPQPARRGPGGQRVRPTPTCAIRPMGEVVTRYHVSLDVADRAGVLAAVAGVFAEHDVSIQTVRQEGRGDGRDAGRGDPRRHRTPRWRPQWPICGGSTSSVRWPA